MIKLTTNHGVITLNLDAEKAPKTVANFLAYMEAGHYNNTIFHRVIDGFMIQGGGFEPGMKQKPADTTVENEAKNGLKNEPYTLAIVVDILFVSDESADADGRVGQTSDERDVHLLATAL